MSKLRRSSAMVLIATGIGLAGCAVRNHPSVGAAAPSAVDSLAATLTELELQRVAILSGRDYQGISTETIGDRIQAMQRSFSNVSEQRAANRRVLLALTIHETTLADELASLRRVFTEEYPTVRRTAEEQRIVSDRIAELRRATSGSRDGQ